MTIAQSNFGGGRYRILEEVGNGGMGTVYRAVQDPLGRQVALKVLRPEFSHHATVRRRFSREARAVAALNHPSIATVFDFGAEADGTLFLAMEFVEGVPLTSLMLRGLTPRHLLAIVDPILAALAHAHARGVIHRDLKPDNILVAFDPATRNIPDADDLARAPQLVKLVDFGIARVRNAPDDPGETASGQVVGTPLYMSPEQARGERTITHASDLYSVGLILFEGLSGRHPFVSDDPDDTSFDVMVRQVTVAPPVLQPPAPVYVPQALRAIVQRCLQKRPSDRYASAAELRSALAETAMLLSGHGAPDPSADQRVQLRRSTVTLGGHIHPVPNHLPRPMPDSDADTFEREDEPVRHSSPTLAVPGPPASISSLQPPNVRFDVPLVGRDHERELLQKAIERCLTGGVGQVVLLSGEAGVGKTKLATWFQENVSEAGQMLCLTGAFLRDSGDGLRGLRDALDTLFGTRGLRWQQVLHQVAERLTAWGVDDPSDADALASFLRPGDAEHTPSKSSQDALFALLVRVLERACRVHPLFILLDDIHWAGGDLAELLEFLAVEFRYRPCNLVIVGTIRSEDLNTNPRLAQGLRRLSRYAAETVTRIDLTRLDEDVSARLIKRILPANDALAEMVVGRSQGNPLHVVQLLQYLYQEQILRWDANDGAFHLVTDDDDAARVPPSLADLLMLRIEQVQSHQDPRLHAPLLCVLDRAAVLGGRFVYEVLTTMVELEADATLSAGIEDSIDALLFEGILVHVKGRGDDMLAFTHGLIREVLLERIASPFQLKKLHRLAAQAKQRFYADRVESVAHDIANHWSAAGDRKKALDFLLMAASTARDTWRLRDATKLFLRAAELAEQADDTGLTLTIARRLGELYEGFGQFRHAERFNATVLRAALFEGHAEPWEPTEDEPEPLAQPDIRLLLEALRTSPRWARHDEGARREIVRATLGLGRVLRQLGKQKIAVSFLEHALHLATDARLLPWINATRVQLGRCAWDEGDWDTADRLGQEVLDTSVDQEDAFGRADALHLLAEVARLRGDPATTADYLTRAREAYAILDDRHAVAGCLRDLAQLARARNDLDHAAQLFTEARRRFELLGDRHAVAACFNGLGEVARFSGNLKIAEQCYQRAYETFRSIGARVDAAVSLTNLGLTAISARKLDRAEKALLLVQTSIRDLQHPYLGLGLHINLALLRAMQGRWDDADAHLLVALDQSDKHDISDPDYARPLEELGKLMLDQGRTQQGTELLRRANAMWSALGH